MFFVLPPHAEFCSDAGVLVSCHQRTTTNVLLLFVLLPDRIIDSVHCILTTLCDVPSQQSAA